LGGCTAKDLAPHADTTFGEPSGLGAEQVGAAKIRVEDRDEIAGRGNKLLDRRFTRGDRRESKFGTADEGCLFFEVPCKLINPRQ
jgi:hypothetical protein